MSSSTTLPGKGAMYEDQYGRTWFVAAGDDVPEEWTKVRESQPLPGEQLDPNNIDGTVRPDVDRAAENQALADRLAELEARLAAVEPDDSGSSTTPAGDTPQGATKAAASKPAVTSAKANPATKTS